MSGPAQCALFVSPFDRAIDQLAGAGNGQRRALRALTKAQRLELAKQEARDRADRDPEIQARRAADKARIVDELARAAERWSKASSAELEGSEGSSSPRGREAVLLAIDPEGYHERQAIEQQAREEQHELLCRRVAELEPAELVELPGLSSSLASIRYGERLRRMGSDPSALSVSENREQCTPPRDRWLGCGRGGAWWLTHQSDADSAAELVEGRRPEFEVVDQPGSEPSEPCYCTALRRGWARCAPFVAPKSVPLELAELEGEPLDELEAVPLELGAELTLLELRRLELEPAPQLEAVPLELGGPLVEPGLGDPDLVWSCVERRPARGSWEPKEPSSKAPRWWKARREAFKLARGLIRIQADRQSNCRRYPLGERVGLHQHRERGADGRARVRLSWAGNETCGSVWACPECSRLIRARRVQELAQLEDWAGARAYLVSLTVAHAMGDDLAKLRAGIANAWRRMVRGEPWARFAKRTGLVGYVKAMEVRHGPNGWHPHIHAIVVGDIDWPRARMERRDAAEWLALRWQSAVVAELGAKHTPNLENGCDVSELHGSGYLVKMGLELALDWTKQQGDETARALRRTPWQIAADWSRWHELEDRELWISYCRGMKGARQLTWSRKLRELCELGEEEPDELVAKDAGQEVGSVDRADWQWLTNATGELGYPYAAHALEVGEHKGLRAMRDWIEQKRRQINPRGVVLRLSRERVNQPWQRNDRRHHIETEREKWRSKRATLAGGATPSSSGSASSSSPSNAMEPRFGGASAAKRP